MTAKILVLGRNGQLATSVRQHPDARAVTLVSAGRAECDMRDVGRFVDFLETVHPDAVINTAAYTDVENAEVEMWPAVTLNGVAVQALARFCERRRTPLVHVSTDYVYDGEKGALYTETDPVMPLSSYGYSKALGDSVVVESGGMVLRTAWLFSGHNKNFARTMMNLAESRDVVRVVNDQYGNPTCADDLAGVCLEMAQRLLDGERHPNLYLVAGAPAVTWADLAEAVFEELVRQGRKRPRLERITTAEYPTQTRRPRDTRFDTSLFHDAVPGRKLLWRERVSEAVSRHHANPGIA